MQKQWFKSWFNSKYYHILYKERDDAEARYFLDKLLAHLQPAASDRVLDIACGKGRHSIYLNEKGFEVTGIDLSFQSIQYAQQFENAKLQFMVHDMRKLFFINYFDLALNLFTSFGYFNSINEHVSALKSFRKSLKPGGRLVIDFFNTHRVLSGLKAYEEKTIQHITFKINKEVKQGCIIKNIVFNDAGHTFEFEEKVQGFYFKDFEKMLKLAGMKIDQHFGNYALEAFNEEESERLILICSPL